MHGRYFDTLSLNSERLFPSRFGKPLPVARSFVPLWVSRPLSTETPLFLMLVTVTSLRSRQLTPRSRQ